MRLRPKGPHLLLESKKGLWWLDMQEKLMEWLPIPPRPWHRTRMLLGQRHCSHLSADGDTNINLEILYIPRHTRKVIASNKALNNGTIMPLPFGDSYLKMTGNLTWKSWSIDVYTCINISICSYGCCASITQAIFKYECQGTGGWMSVERCQTSHMSTIVRKVEFWPNIWYMGENLLI